MIDDMADEDVMVAVREPLPRISCARWLDDYVVDVLWTNGHREDIDLAPAIFNHRHFVRLRSDIETFRLMSVADWGSALAWPGGIELSAEWIDRLPRRMSNSEFRDAMTDMGMTLDGMSKALSIARRSVAEYRKDKKIPNYVALAVNELQRRFAPIV